MRRLAVAVSLIIGVLGIRYGTFTAGGADSYGYVSQADLWLARTLIVEQPLGRDAPWRAAVWTLSPLGYRPGDERGTMVPTYSPGLPMTMAVFKAIAGAEAVYYVVPTLGALAVWLTYVFASQLAGAHAGALAAISLAASPAFLFQLMWPMSDVPAMTGWLGAVVLALGRTSWHTVGCGLATSAAILTRPNLLGLAAPVLALVALRQATWPQAAARCATCGLMMLPGAVAVGAINQHIYGSALTSGYGGFEIYSTGNFWLNATRYPRWLVETQTPFVLLALISPYLLARRGLSDAATIARVGLGFTLILFLTYAWYMPFDEWTYLRFLLPAYPLLLGLAAAALTTLAPVSGRPRTAAFVLLAITLAGWGMWRGRVAFHAQEEEQRHQVAGYWAGGLPDNAVVISNRHSGSVRHYGHRVTLRFEWLYPEAYQEAMAYLHTSGKRTYAVLDDVEREIFRQRYSSVADVSWLDREPLLVAAGRVYFYEIPPATAVPNRE